MIARAFGVVIAFSTIFAQPASAVEPIGGWRIEPSDVRCVAVRQYGTANNPITLALKASVEGKAYQLAILRSGLQRESAQTEATATIDGKSFETTALTYPTGGNKRRVTHLMNLSSEASTDLRSARELKVAVIEGSNESFSIDAPTSVWTSMDECVSALRDRWNVGMEHAGNLSSYANGDLRPLFSRDDYPLGMILADKTGTATFGLLIDETGRVKDCTVMEPSGVAVLDSRSCGIIIERAKLTPAVGADGKPAKSFWVQKISWKLAF